MRDSSPSLACCLVSLLALSCVDQRDDDFTAPTTAAISKPAAIEAGARVAFRINDPEGRLRAGDFDWDAENDLGSFEEFTPGAEEVFLLAGAAFTGLAKVRATSQDGSGLILEEESSIDPIVFSPTAALPDFLGGDERTIRDAHTAWRGDTSLVGLSVEGKYALLARFQPGQAASFTHLTPEPSSPDEVVRILDLALTSDGDVYLVRQNPEEAQSSLQRWLFDATSSQYQLDESFLPPLVDYLAVAVDVDDTPWVAVQPADPRTWRLNPVGEIEEIVVWPTGANSNVRGFGVGPRRIVLANEATLYFQRRDDESAQRTTAVAGGEITDLALDAFDRAWVSVLESDSTGSLRVIGSTGQEVATVAQYSQQSGVDLGFEQPLALAVNEQGDLRVLDDVQTAAQPSPALARWIAIDREAVVPNEELILDPPGGLLYVGARLRVRATTASGAPVAIHWESPIGGLDAEESLSGDEVGYDAAPFLGTYPVTVSLVDDPSVRRTAYFTTTAFNFRLDSAILGPGSNGSDLSAMVAAGTQRYHIAYQNPDTGASNAMILRRSFSGLTDDQFICNSSGPDCLAGCQEGFDCEATDVFSDFVPEWLNVASDPADNAYWVDDPQDDGQPITLRRWRSDVVDGTFDSLLLPDLFGDDVRDQFQGAIAAGPALFGNGAASVYVTLRSDSNPTELVRYDVDEDFQLIDTEIVAMLPTAGNERDLLAVDPDGSVLVTRTTSSPLLERLVPQTAGGYLVEPVAWPIHATPQSLAVDGSGRIFVALSDRVVVVGPKGQDLATADGPVTEIVQYDSAPQGPGEDSDLEAILGMAVSLDGRVRIVDDAFFPENDQASAGAAADPQ